MSSTLRPEMVSSAVTFLTDPTVQSRTLSERVSFLESKGLSTLEIDEAMRQSGQSNNLSTTTPNPNSNSVTPRGINYGQGGVSYPQVHPYYQNGINAPPQSGMGRDWRDWFIMAVVSGTVGYGVISLARKYLLPHLQPPNASALETDHEALTAKYDEVAAQLQALDQETKAVRSGIDQQKELVENSIKEVESAVKDMRDGDKKREEDMRKVKEEVDEIKEQLPKMLEKTREAQSASLTDLQTELKSLKSLLVSRGSSIGTRPSYGLNATNNNNNNNSGSSSPSLNNNNNNEASPVNPTASSNQNTSGIPIPTNPTSPLPFGGKQPSIPAWQLASNSTPATNSSTSPSTPSKSIDSTS